MYIRRDVLFNVINSVSSTAQTEPITCITKHCRTLQSTT